MLNSVGLKLARAAQLHRKTRARARARWQFCIGVLGVLGNRKQVPLLCLCVADRLQISPPSSISSQTKVHDGVHARRGSGEVLDRPIGAMTGAQLRSKSNSLPGERFP
jgi:hypothetical protein